MPAAVNQDFLTYVGDISQPIFTVLGLASTTTGLSTALDISTATGGVTDIQWSLRRNLTDSVIATLSKSGGAIVYPGTAGTDGKFQVNISSTVTAGLSGWYIHTATIFQGSSAPTTVTVGRVNIGQAPNWTWDPGSVGVEQLYTVRNMIGDTIQADQLLTDQQVNWAISQYSNEWLAAAECARNIYAFYSRQVDTVQGELRTMYSQRAKTYRLLAIDLEARGFTRSGAGAYAGGTSLGDKQTNALNSDRTPPQFVIGMFDNLLPETPVGHETGAGQNLPTAGGSGDFGILGGP